MSEARTVLVLTPSLGGHYFGELVAGLTREVAGAGGRLVVVATLPEGDLRGELSVPGVFAIPVAWSLVDGAVAITTAVDARYLQQLRDRGRAVVLSSALLDGFAAPSAMPDNDRGTVAAVEHLVRHGHTRIGFVGNLGQQDIRERHAAYRRVLEGHGLVPDPADLFVVSDNTERGGGEAARALLERAQRPTALMVGTDLNALGMMRVLTAAGLALPEELAIVGYDNVEAAAFSVPSLTSVDQRFEEVGSLAGRLVLAAARGEEVPAVTVTSDSVDLTVRTSCGCPAGGSRGRPVGAVPTVLARDALRDELRAALLAALPGGEGEGVGSLRSDVAATVSRIEHLMTSGEIVTDAQIRELTGSLRVTASRPAASRRISAALVAYAEGIDDLRGPGTDKGAGDVATALWKAQAGAFLRRAETTELAIAEQYAVDAGLLDTVARDPRDLDWLVCTHVKAGVLALWDDGSTTGPLSIVGTYGPVARLGDLVGTVLGAEHFPPEPLIASVDAGKQEVCVVVPVRSARREWGVLAVVGAIDTTSVRETYQHWAALLAVALESQRLQGEIRRSALYDPLTELPNRRLFLERLDGAIARAARSGVPFATLFLDLDGFKAINDSLGHHVGDRVLAVVGERIARELRSVDTGARFGGDEFAILLDDTGLEGALLVADRVRDALREPMDLHGSRVSIGASTGVATSAAGYRSSEEVLRDADAAMYRAKAREPGAVVVFDQVMRAAPARALAPEPTRS